MGIFTTDTAGEEAVKKATNDILIQPDLEQNLVISDMCNQSTQYCCDVVKTLRKRLKSKKENQVLLALELADMVLKNGRRHVANAFASPRLEFLPALGKACLKFSMTRASDRAAELLATWATNFPDRKGEFKALFDQMERSGVVFPAIDKTVTKAPKRSVPASASAAAVAPSARAPREGYLEKLRRDMEVVFETIQLTQRMLREARDSEQDREVLTGLMNNLTEIRSRFMDLVVSVQDDTVVDFVLRVNDHVNGTLARSPLDFDLHRNALLEELAVVGDADKYPQWQRRQQQLSGEGTEHPLSDDASKFDSSAPPAYPTPPQQQSVDTFDMLGIGPAPAASEPAASEQVARVSPEIRQPAFDPLSNDNDDDFDFNPRSATSPPGAAADDFFDDFNPRGS